MIVSSLADDDRDDWDRFVSNARNSHFMFRQGYMSYHRDRFVDASLVCREGSEIIAAFPATVHGSEVRSHGGLSFGGLLTGPNIGAAATLAAYEMICAHFAANGYKNLRVKPVPHIYHQMPSEEELYALFRLGAKLARRDLAAVINLAHPGEYRKNKHLTIKKARNAAVVVRECRSFHEFGAMLAGELQKRHSAAPTHTADEIERLSNLLPDHITLLGGFAGDDLIAGAWMFKTERVHHTQYLIANDQGRATGALDLVIDTAIQMAAGSAAYFSFGHSNENDGRSLNEGLAFFKEAFGARGVVLDHFDIELG